MFSQIDDKTFLNSLICTHLVGTQCWKIYNSETLEVHFPTSNTFLRHVELLFLAYLKEKKSLCLLTCCLSFCSDMWKDNISIEKSSTKQTFWDSLGTFGMLWSISWTVGKSRKYRDDDSRCRWQVCNLHRIPNTILKRRARESHLSTLISWKWLVQLLEERLSLF